MKNGSSADIARPVENVFMVANDHVSVERSIVVEDELLHLADDASRHCPKAEHELLSWRNREARKPRGCC